MNKIGLKQLVNLANKLDARNMVEAANAVDKFIKMALTNVSERDLNQAIQFFNDMNLSELTPADFTVKGVTMMKPEEFMPGLDTSDQGWLKKFPIEQWPELLTQKYTRDFSHIVRMYREGNMSPAIQIDGMFADGMARSIFYNAIGETMPVAELVSNKQETELI